MSDNNKFKNRLKQLRKEFGMTQQDLANKIGIVRTAIANYETGRTIPDSETLSIIAKIFNTTTDYLLGNSDIRNPYNEEPDEVDEFLMDLKSEAKKRGIEFDENSVEDLLDLYEFIKKRDEK